ncbi:ISCpe5, transposase, partial [Listeria seeligeri FSL S4-171]
HYFCDSSLFFLIHKQKYQHYLTILGKRNSFSKTDYDATFMRMKEALMRNS